MGRIKTWLVGLLTALLVGVSGCSVLDTLKSNETIARVALQEATVKVVDNDRDLRNEIVNGAEYLKEYVNADSKVRLTKLEELVVQSDAWQDLSDSKKRIIAAVYEQYKDNLQEKMDDNVVDGEAKVVVNKTFDWVIQAAQGVEFEDS